MPGNDGMTTQPRRLVVWDFDGTLADTYEAIRAATDAALRAHGFPAPDEVVLRSLIGLSLDRVFVGLTGVRDPDRVEALMASYRIAFATAGPRQTTLFEGIGLLLDELHDTGVVSAIATSKGRRGVELMLDRLGIAGHFATVISDEDVAPGRGKPQPDMALWACRLHGIDPVSAVVIGDTIFDVEMGQRAGAETIGVTWGNQPPVVLAEAKPGHLVDQVEQLASLLRLFVGERAR